MKIFYGLWFSSGVCICKSVGLDWPELTRKAEETKGYGLYSQLCRNNDRVMSNTPGGETRLVYPAQGDNSTSTPGGMEGLSRLAGCMRNISVSKRFSLSHKYDQNRVGKEDSRRQVVHKRRHGGARAQARLRVCGV